jgi:N-acetylmuramic acid 6-phosphate etherase
MEKPDLDALVTEQRNPRTADLDRMPTLDLLRVMNDEDRGVAGAVAGELPRIAAAVDAIAQRMAAGGRLFYCGAGTSGRLGVLDAVECRPTFSAVPGQVQGVIAGGAAAFAEAVEGAEDSADLGARDLAALALRREDSVVGIAASGRTPYVLGALAHARAAGALRIAVVCSPRSPVAAAAEIAIEVVCGPEVLTGSTRLKAGTATKMVLNMLSTGAFVRLHKTYGNLMVDVQATNAKLRERSVRIVALATGRDRAVAERGLGEAGGEVKTAIVAILRGVAVAEARGLLRQHAGSVRAAVEARR